VTEVTARLHILVQEMVIPHKTGEWNGEWGVVTRKWGSLCREGNMTREEW